MAIMPSHTVLHVVITCLLLTLFSSAQPLEDELAKRTTCRASDTQITGLAQAIANPVSFCKWWLLVDRSRSPFSTLQYTAIDYACGCISDNPRLVTVKPSAPKASTNAVKLARDVAKPVPFCTFWTAMPGRSNTPFTDLSEDDIYTECRKVLAPTSSRHSSSTQKSSSRMTTSKRVSTSSVRTSTTHKVTSASSSPLSTASLLPIRNADLDRAATANLKPATSLTLYYAEASPGLTAASIRFNMSYPTVDLDSSSLINKITCAKSSQIVFSVPGSPSALSIVKAWPQKDLVLLTNSDQCNACGSRGVYKVTSWTLNGKTFTLKVAAVSWPAVAKTMDIKYGTRSPTAALVPSCPSSSAASSSLTSSSRTTVRSTTVSPSPFVIPTAYTDLTPGAKELVDTFVRDMKYADDGEIILDNTKTTPVTVPMPDFDSNSTLTPAVETALQAAGLDDPSTITQDAESAIAGVCGGNGKGNVESTFPKRSLVRRWDPFDDSDLLCGLVGAFSEGAGDVCEGAAAAKDIYDNRQAIGCMFTGCYSSTPAPPTYQYTFDYSWNAYSKFPPNSDVISWTDGTKLTCIDCQLSISQIRITGSISVVLATGSILGASITVSETSTANMVLELNSKRAYSDTWDAGQDTQNLNSITVDKVFTITPALVTAFGAQFSTDRAVDVTAGARMSWNGASASVDLSTLAVTNIKNWQPNLSIVSPTFAHAGTVTIYPYMRRMYNIKFSIFGSQVSNTATFGSQTAIGFNAQTLDTATGSCVAGQLRLQSYASNKQVISFNTGSNVLLNSLAGAQPEQCINVPLDKPSAADISTLAAVGQQFCTSYINYIPSTKGVYVATTSTVPRTVTTSTTIYVTSTPTVTTSTTTTAQNVRTITTMTYVTGDAAGTQSVQAPFFKRAERLPQPTPQLARRAVATPAIVATWSASKISFACSQVATGTVTSTFTTSTATVTSGTTTSISTDYQPTVGMPTTTTLTSTAYTWSTSVYYSASSTLSASCPIQTQESCFKITAHGRPGIEGKQLGVANDRLVPGLDRPSTTFYVDCEGALVSLPDYRVLTGADSTGFLSFSQWSDSSSRASCTKDVVQGTISCSLGGSDIMWIPELDPYWESTWYSAHPLPDSRNYMPMWNAAGLAGESYYPISWTYQEAACPCGTPQMTTDLSIYSTTTPVCPAADTTTFQTSDGATWQVQCNMDYPEPGFQLDVVPATSLLDCLQKCDTYGADHNGMGFEGEMPPASPCYGVVYVPSRYYGCYLKERMDTAAYITTDATHSVVRLTEKALPNSY